MYIYLPYKSDPMKNSTPSRRQFIKQSTMAAGTLMAMPLVSDAGIFNTSFDDTIRVALIGCGGRGTGAAMQAMLSKQNVKLVAMADAFRDRLDECYNALTADDISDWSGSTGNIKDKITVTEEHKFVGFDAYQKAMALADVVILTTPPGFRPVHFEAAVNLGKHIFMEKPVATDPAGIKKVLEVAEKAKQKKLNVVVGLQRPNQRNNDAPESDSEPLTLTRQQFQEMVKAEASKLAPTLKEQNAEIERRQGVVQSLAKTWGQERFDELSSDLDDAFGGLSDSSGRPKPAIEAVFEADEPAKVIEYLADPDNADEAERIARMSAIQAGKAIARLEDKLKADAAKAKPQPSKQPPPLESVRSQGGVPSAPDPSDTKAWIRYHNEQERKGLA
jgi:hypothetical protein